MSFFCVLPQNCYIAVLINSNLTMKSKTFYLLGILFTIVIGTFLYCHYCCSIDHKTTSNNTVGVVEPVEVELLDNGVTKTDEEDIVEEKITLNEVCDAMFAESFVLTFNTGESAINLNPTQQEDLNTIADCISKLGTELTIIGHTDDTGNATKNLEVGKQRADAVKALLIEKGVSEDKITTTSKGESEPIASNTTEEGRAKNRRIQIKTN